MQVGEDAAYGLEGFDPLQRATHMGVRGMWCIPQSVDESTDGESRPATQCFRCVLTLTVHNGNVV